jgi:hypothetical protein
MRVSELIGGVSYTLRRQRQSILVITACQLNERMYDELQGLNKQETADRYGKVLAVPAAPPWRPPDTRQNVNNMQPMQVSLANNNPISWNLRRFFSSNEKHLRAISDREIESAFTDWMTASWSELSDSLSDWMTKEVDVEVPTDEEEYSKLYHSLAKDFGDNKPMAWSHFNAEHEALPRYSGSVSHVQWGPGILKVSIQIWESKHKSGQEGFGFPVPLMNAIAK